MMCFYAIRRFWLRVHFMGLEKKHGFCLAVLGIGLIFTPLPPAAQAQQKEFSHSSRALPDSVVIRQPGLFPEGLAWDSTGHRFFVSSITRGTLTAVRDDGSHQIFAPGEDLKSTFGIFIDNKRDRLLVTANDAAALGDSTNIGQAKLAVYNLKSGHRTRLIDLAALQPDCRHMANDITLGPQGNAYVTDSLCPVIYKVTPAGKASVFAKDARLGGHGFDLNGIVYHPGGYLLAALDAKRGLYKIPLNHPGHIQKVKINQKIAPDGIRLMANGNIIDAEPNLPAVLELSSDDGWKSARIIKRMPTTRRAFTTAVTLRAGTVYVLKSKITQMHEKSPVKNFVIFRADLH